ncbi:hypothetical protein SKA53_07861 [Yoonia vestfoldensis SKA53]|uniref:Uncharacterized protein n=1 Tax=Yoonia vestfoldensis SKA53 TaxID=314232 RepID=A3V6Y8_9RHOB|nr:hypothetical protein SKA53_07861 [Yoonia vestfoldensis SKA53]
MPASLLSNEHLQAFFAVICMVTPKNAA